MWCKQLGCMFCSWNSENWFIHRIKQTMLANACEGLLLPYKNLLHLVCHMCRTRKSGMWCPKKSALSIEYTLQEVLSFPAEFGCYAFFLTYCKWNEDGFARDFVDIFAWWRNFFVLCAPTVNLKIMCSCLGGTSYSVSWGWNQGDSQPLITGDQQSPTLERM